MFSGRREGETRTFSTYCKCVSSAPFRILRFVFLHPHSFATLCLISCAFTGKAISQINEYKCSVWYLFVHVANFQLSLPLGIRMGYKPDNPKWCFSSLLSVCFLPNHCLEARFSSFSFLCSFYSGVTNNKSSYKMDSRKAQGKSKGLPRLLQNSQEQNVTKENDGCLFLLWLCLKCKSQQKPDFPFTWFSWLQETHSGKVFLSLNCWQLLRLVKAALRTQTVHLGKDRTRKWWSTLFV